MRGQRRGSASETHRRRDAERTVQRGRFVCPREGVERSWRLVALHRTRTGYAEGAFEQRSSQAYAGALVCEGCSHRYEPEAARPLTDAAREELYRMGLAAALAALSHERVDDPDGRAAAIARVAQDEGLASLPAFDAGGFEALARRLDAHLRPEQREGLIRVACDVGRSGRVRPFVSSVLQVLGGALGYGAEALEERFGVGTGPAD